MHQLIPRFIIDRYFAGEFSGSLEAAGLFIDLTGFSTMADILSGYEQSGAEVLADVMRAIFEPLVAAVYSQGGFVVGFIGDAFTAIFTERQGFEPAMLRCLGAAIKMQAHARENPLAETPYGQYSMSIKIGISYGKVDWKIIKSSDGDRITYYIHGTSVDGAVNAEKCAQPGELLVNKMAYERLRAYVDGRPVDECYRVINVRQSDLPSPRFLSDPYPDPEDLHIFLPESILNLPTVGEFRQVVNLFIDIPIDPTDDELVIPFIDVVFELQERYGGYYLPPEISDKGFNLLMFWGAPVAYETDIERTLNFILDLKAKSGLPLKAGITYLSAYAGFMGASLREDYTAYGWGVNLAARFMKMAVEDAIWIDEEVARRAERHFDVKYRDTLAVKGFANKQKVFTLFGRKELTETVYHGRLIGRDQEIERLSNFVMPIFVGEFAGVLVIQGEAGIGKSRLIHSFQETAIFDNREIKWMVCQTDEILRQSLNPFRTWLFKRFLISDSQSENENLENFNTQLQEIINSIPGTALASELERTSSVLAAVLGLYQSGSLYEQLDAKERYENTFIALSTLFRAESLQKPLILFIEDIQWLDDDTRSFLPYFVRTLIAEPDTKYPIAILTSRRPEGDTLQFDGVLEPQEIILDRLTPGDLSHLAEHVLDGRISVSLLDLLERRSEGNPFFAEQILRYLSEKDLLSKDAGGLYDADIRVERSLPMDIGAVLIARLDSLKRDVRDVVQTASILGREFEVQVLSRILRGEVDLPQKINEAEHAEIWFPLDQIRYIFHHALLREAAYSMQLLARQRELHAMAVSAMETLYENEFGPHYGELAYHAERASLNDKALLYLPLAGKMAASVYQNKQAVDFFSRAIALEPKGNLRAQFEHLLSRAKIYGLMGERHLQVQDLDALENMSRQLGDDALLSQVLVMRADYDHTVSDYQNALAHARQALDLARASGEKDVALDAYRVSSLTHLRQGNLNEAMKHVEEGLQLVRKLGKRIEEGKILNTMGLIALEQKEPASAKFYFEQALSIARETFNRGLETKSLNNLGNSAGIILGDYVAAREYYEQAYLIARERGDRSLQSATLVNLGWAAGMQGDFDSARTYHEQASLLAREVGDLYHETYTLINLSAVAVSQAEIQAAIKYAQQANALSQKIGERSGEAWSLLYLGHAYLLDQRYKLARDTFQESITIREELGQRGLTFEPSAGLILVALETNDLSTASNEAEKILLHLENGGNFEGAEEPLRIYLACFQALKKIEDPRSATVLQDAVRLLETQVSKLHDAQAREMYIQNVPCRRDIQEAWNASQKE